jgi:hypothetical protein
VSKEALPITLIVPIAASSDGDGKPIISESPPEMLIDPFKIYDHETKSETASAQLSQSVTIVPVTDNVPVAKLTA